MWLTNFLSEIQNLTNPRWWVEQQSLSVKKNWSLMKNPGHWWSLILWFGGWMGLLLSEWSLKEEFISNHHQRIWWTWPELSTILYWLFLLLLLCVNCNKVEDLICVLQSRMMVRMSPTLRMMRTMTNIVPVFIFESGTGQHPPSQHWVKSSGSSDPGQ